MGCCDTLGNIFRLAILLGIGGALTLQWFAVYSCEFVKVGDSEAGVGLFFLPSGDECTTEAYETEDGLISGARSAIILSMCAGLIGGGLILFEWVLCAVCCAGCIEGLCLSAAWMVGGATYMFYGSETCIGGTSLEEVTEEDVNCAFGQGSTFLSTACFFYMCCGIVLCIAPQPDPLCKQ